MVDYKGKPVKKTCGALMVIRAASLRLACQLSGPVCFPTDENGSPGAVSENTIYWKEYVLHSARNYYATMRFAMTHFATMRFVMTHLVMTPDGCTLCDYKP